MIISSPMYRLQFVAEIGSGKSRVRIISPCFADPKIAKELIISNLYLILCENILNLFPKDILLTYLKSEEYFYLRFNYMYQLRASIVTQRNLCGNHFS